MKLLVVAPQWFPDAAGGQARVVSTTAIGLAERGHDVEVIVPRASGRPGYELTQGVAIHRAVRRSALPRSIVDIPQFAAAIRQYSPQSFDAIIAHGGTAGAAAGMIRPHRPTAYVFHSSAALEARDRRERGLDPIEAIRSRLVEPVLSLSERLAVRRADRLLVLSRFSEGLLKSRHPTLKVPTTIVGGGVDGRLFGPAPDRAALRARLGISASDKVMLTVRRLVPRMGLETLFAAFARVRREAQGAKLVVVGDGELRPSLEALRDDFGMAGDVRFLGVVTDADLVQWYQAADLFVLPTVAYEGFGMATVEALACGTPVVGTTVGATPEILGPFEPSLLVRDSSASALTEKLEEILAGLDDHLRNRCSEYAASRFAWDRVLTRWERAVDQMLGQESGVRPAAQ